MAESVALTPEEQRRLRPLFGQYDLEDSSIVLGERVRPLLEKSGLPPAQLGQIWQIVDYENRGFLDFHGFAKCMRLIAHAQQGVAVSPKMANIPSGMPDFSRQPLASPTSPSQPPQPPPQPATQLPASSHVHRPSISQRAQPLASFSTGGSTTSANGETRIPQLTTIDKNRYGALFDRSITPGGDGLLDGTAAREIFLKAHLPEETLGRIWSLVDVAGRGRLTKNEFVVAMHLIQCLITRTMPALPSALPPAWHPWLGSGHVRQGSQTAHNPSSVPLSVQLSGRSPVLSQVTSPVLSPAHTAHPLSAHPSGSLAISPEDRVQYDAIFDSLDHGKVGILGPNEAVPLLTKSKLSEDILAKIWDLSDTRKRGQLDKGDFALAMHFVKAKLNGLPLPDHVSPGAGAASHPSQNQPQPPAPKAPTRSATQISASSLTDLVSLDSAVFKPLEPAKPRRAQTEVDESKFVPTTSFGQNLLKNKTPLPQVKEAPSPQQPSQHNAQSNQDQPNLVQNQASSPQAGGLPKASSLQASQAQASQAQVSQVQSLERQVTAMKADSARANEELAMVLKEKADLDRKLATLRETYDSGTKLVHETQQQVRKAREEIKQLEKDIALRTSGLDAIKTQHAQELKTRDALLAQKTELETQHNTAQSELDRLTAEAEGFSTEKLTHQQTISQHQARLQQFHSDIEASRWKRQQLEAEAQQHRERALQATEEAQRAEAQHAEMQLSDQHLSQSPSQPTGQPQTQQLGQQHEQPAQQQTHLEPVEARDLGEQRNLSAVQGSAAAAAIESIGHPEHVSHAQTLKLNRVDSLGSFSNAESVPLANADTPRTSPPTSEANFPSIDANMPTFTLPMDRPLSVTSSVVNNAPQSVRGDIGSEPSERQSPEFPQIPSRATTPLDLDHANDSFEFVDAQQSSDDEGPDNAIPRRYSHQDSQSENAASANSVPPMPGAFPKELEVPLAQLTDSEQRHVELPEKQAEPIQFYSQQATLNEQLQHDSPQLDSYQSALSEQRQHSEVSGVTIKAPPEPPADDFDEFDDLEEAREDESESFAVEPTGPDEWQQLFTGHNAPAASDPSQADPFSFAPRPSSDSREVAELTSMGFTDEEARSALQLHNHNLGEATNYLLDRMQ